MKIEESLSVIFDEDEFQPVFKRALRYAIISLPWTVNRMAYSEKESGLERRLRNIVLGKLPEYLMVRVFRDYGIPIDSIAGETDFWKRDNFDFLLHIDGHREEWDLKCLTVPFAHIVLSGWLELPALIPDRHRHDQWSRRDHTVLPDSRCKRYLFIYLDNPGLCISLAPEQKDVYHEIIENPRNYIRQDDFILRTIGDVRVKIKSPHLRLVVTAVAGPEEWAVFKTIPADTQWPGAPVHTRIRNKGVAIKYLPSFLKVCGRKKLQGK